MNKATMPTREQYKFLRFKYTYAILHADPATKLVAIHNLMHLMAFYASSDELEEIFAKPLSEKLLQKYSQPLHADAFPPILSYDEWEAIAMPQQQQLVEETRHD